MAMSSSTTSHGWLRMNDSACAPVPASPTTSQVGLLGDELLQAGADDGMVVGNQDADAHWGSRNGLRVLGIGSGVHGITGRFPTGWMCARAAGACMTAKLLRNTLDGKRRAPPRPATALAGKAGSIDAPVRTMTRPAALALTPR